MRGQKGLDSANDLKESIAHLDQVSARIARLLVDLATPKTHVDVQSAEASTTD